MIAKTTGTSITVAAGGRITGIGPTAAKDIAKVLKSKDLSEGPAGKVARAERHVAKMARRKGRHPKQTQARLKHLIESLESQYTLISSPEVRAESIARYRQMIIERRTAVAKAQIPKLMKAVEAWAEKLGVEISMKAENGGVTVNMNYQGAERTAHIPIEGRTSAKKFAGYVETINKQMERIFPG